MKMWIYAADAAEVADGEAVQVLRDDKPPLALFNVNGDFYCIDDTCTHDQASLSDGYIEGDMVECALHFAKFAIRTGAVLSAPAIVPVNTYGVKVVDGKVYVDA